jgi:uncharacterized protein
MLQAKHRRHPWIHRLGIPHAGSDVDILVIMPTRNELTQAWRIDGALPRNSSLRLIVRTPKNMEWRLREDDWFLREFVERGQDFYERTEARVAPQGARDRSQSERVIRALVHRSATRTQQFAV